MGHFSDDFRWLTTDSEQEITEFYAWILNLEAEGRSHGDHSRYEFRFLLDGSEDGWQHSASQQEIQHNAVQLADHLQREAKQQQAEREAAEKKAEEERKAREKEARDRKEFERLKAKFGQ